MYEKKNYDKWNQTLTSDAESIGADAFTQQTLRTKIMLETKQSYTTVSHCIYTEDSLIMLGHVYLFGGCRETLRL